MAISLVDAEEVSKEEEKGEREAERELETIVNAFDSSFLVDPFADRASGRRREMLPKPSPAP